MIIKQTKSYCSNVVRCKHMGKEVIISEEFIENHMSCESITNNDIRKQLHEWTSPKITKLNFDLVQIFISNGVFNKFKLFLAFIEPLNTSHATEIFVSRKTFA